MVLVSFNCSSVALTLTDRWFGDLPVLQLVVDADHQHVVPRNPTEVHTHIVHATVTFSTHSFGFAGSEVRTF